MAGPSHASLQKKVTAREVFSQYTSHHIINSQDAHRTINSIGWHRYRQICPQLSDERRRDFRLRGATTQPAAGSIQKVSNKSQLPGRERKPCICSAGRQGGGECVFQGEGHARGDCAVPRKNRMFGAGVR